MSELKLKPGGMQEFPQWASSYSVTRPYQVQLKSLSGDSDRCATVGRGGAASSKTWPIAFRRPV
jgi:hypothetical protein